MKHGTQLEAIALCQYLNWDSDFFGYRIARVVSKRLALDTVGPILSWCDAQKIDCLYFLCDATDETTVRLAEDHSFRLVDIRMTFENRLESALDSKVGGSQAIIRPFMPEDLPDLRAIARVNFRLTRFYFDPNFPESLCDALYETWTEKSCSGYADAVLVAEIGGQAHGYITCHLFDQNLGKIGLVGVGADWQGKGLGRDLVSSSLRWFAERGVRKAEVVTQGTNPGAQRLYQKCGFMTQSVCLWYHRWFTRLDNKA
jgi:dTDP-4-amino-4,6-dideoxy-D-galactose acyltransferase